MIFYFMIISIFFKSAIQSSTQFFFGLIDIIKMDDWNFPGPTDFYFLVLTEILSHSQGLSEVSFNFYSHFVTWKPPNRYRGRVRSRYVFRDFHIEILIFLIWQKNEQNIKYCRFKVLQLLFFHNFFKNRYLCLKWAKNVSRSCTRSRAVNFIKPLKPKRP